MAPVEISALMEQSIDEFTSRGLNVRSASSRDELMKDFRSNNLVENKEGALEIMVANGFSGLSLLQLSSTAFAVTTKMVVAAAVANQKL